MPRLTEQEKQDIIRYLEADKKGNRIVAEKGRIVKVTRDKNGIVKREIVRVMKDISRRDAETQSGDKNGEWEEVWTGDYVFENDTMTIVDVKI